MRDKKYKTQYHVFDNVELGYLQSCRTYIKGIQMFDFFNNLIIETRVKHKDIVKYLPMSYYYDQTAEYFQRSPNYVNAWMSAMTEIGEVRRMALLRKSQIYLRD